MFSLLDSGTKRTIKKMAIKIYSAITDGKDNPREDGVLTFGKYNKFAIPVMNAKIYKILPHFFFNTEYSIWIDGNLTLKKTPEELVKLLGDKDIALFPNPYRTCPFDEADYCIKHNIGTEPDIKRQQERYKGQIPKCPLGACGVIIRRHTEEMKTLCEKWWAEICFGSTRDQISFPFVFPNEKINWLPFQSNIINNSFFTRKGHTK